MSRSSGFREKMVAFTGKHEDALRKSGLMSVFSSISFLISAADFTKKSLVVRDGDFLIGDHKMFSLFGSSGDGGKLRTLVPNTIVSSTLFSLENAMAATSHRNSVKGNKYLIECYSGISRDELSDLVALSNELCSAKKSNSYTKDFVSCISVLSGNNLDKKVDNDISNGI